VHLKQTSNKELESNLEVQVHLETQISFEDFGITIPQTIYDEMSSDCSSTDSHTEEYTVARNFTLSTIKLAHLVFITYWINQMRLWFSLPDISLLLRSSHIHHYNHLTLKWSRTLTNTAGHLNCVLFSSSFAYFASVGEIVLDECLKSVPWLHCLDNYCLSLPSDNTKSPYSVSRVIWSWQHSRIWYIIVVMMFGRFIRPCRTRIWATPESWWRSLALFT